MPVLRGSELLERGVELDELRACLLDARESAGRLVLVEGAAGIGKTSLLRAAREAASEQGLRVLSARGSQLERDFPFALVRQLFEPVLRAAGPDERERLLDEGAHLAAGVIGIAPADASAGREEAFVDPSFATLNALYWLTSNLAEEGPVLLAVDDAHWADEPSLRYLGFLLPRLDGLPVAVVVGSRAGEPGASPLLAALVSDPSVRALRPAVLSQAAVAEIVRHTLGGEADEVFCAACYEASGGNPFLLAELLVQLSSEVSAGSAAEAAHVREVAPETIRRAVLVRLARLGDDARRLAQAVAVLGDGAELRDAVELAGLELDAAGPPADALATAGVLEPGRPLRFVHPLIRNAVYAELPQAAKAHAHAAQLLEARGAEPERIALHLILTDTGAVAGAADMLVAAADRALARAAPEAAASYLFRALAESPGEAERRAVIQRLVVASIRDPNPELRARVEALDPVAGLRAEPGLAVERSMAVSLWLFSAGRFEEATVIAERAIAAANEAGDIAAALEYEAGIPVLTHMPPPEIRTRFARYESAISQGGPGQRLWRALQAFVSIFTPGAAAAEAAELARQALEDGRLVFEYLFTGPAGLACWTLIKAERPELARQTIDAIDESARAVGALPLLTSASNLRAEASLQRGDVAEAAEHARGTVDLARTGGFLFAFPTFLSVLVEALIERDEPEAAAAELSASSMAGALPETYFFMPVMAARARLRLVQGRPEEANEELAAYDLLGERLGVVNPHSDADATAVATLAALGETGEAERRAEAALAVARAWGAAAPVGRLLVAQARLRRGRPGIELLREAVAALEPSVARLEYARALMELGAALRRDGHRAEAREPLRAALDMARRGGALAVARRVHEELEATGEKLRPLMASGVESLTPSERRVAGLAAQGKTNRQVAQTLFLTVKTVETHLSHAYRKLDIGSRAELAAALGGDDRGTADRQRPA